MLRQAAAEKAAAEEAARQEAATACDHRVSRSAPSTDHGCQAVSLLSQRSSRTGASISLSSLQARARVLLVDLR